MIKELVQECPFEFSQEKKVGHMRGDFADGRLANRWFPTAQTFDGLTSEEKQEIQMVCNELLCQHVDTFEKIVAYCGAQGYGNETNLFTQSEHFDYWVRLNPVQEDYAIYIHTYRQ